MSQSNENQKCFAPNCNGLPDNKTQLCEQHSKTHAIIPEGTSISEDCPIYGGKYDKDTLIELPEGDTELKNILNKILSIRERKKQEWEQQREKATAIHRDFIFLLTNLYYKEKPNKTIGNYLTNKLREKNLSYEYYKLGVEGRKWQDSISVCEIRVEDSEIALDIDFSKYDDTWKYVIREITKP